MMLYINNLQIMQSIYDCFNWNCSEVL